MTVYNFKIFHKSRKTNFANESSKRSDYEETSTLNIKLLSSLQSKLTLSKNMRDFSKISDDAFEIINVRKLDFTLNARNSKEIFKNTAMRSNAQKFEFSKNIKNLRKMFKNTLSKSNVYINAFI